MSFKMNITTRPSPVPYVSTSALLSLIAAIQFHMTNSVLQTLFHNLPQYVYFLQLFIILLLCALPLILWRFTFFILDAGSLQLSSFTMLFLRRNVNFNRVSQIRVTKSGLFSSVTGSKKVEFIDSKGRVILEWNPVRPSEEVMRKLRRTSLLLHSENQRNKPTE
jgi:hypothetical protein